MNAIEVEGGGMVEVLRNIRSISIRVRLLASSELRSTVVFKN